MLDDCECQYGHSDNADCDPYITHLPGLTRVTVSCFNCHWSSDQVFYGSNRIDSAFDHFDAHHTLTAFKR